MVRGKGRPKRKRALEKLGKEEREHIYYERSQNGGKDMKLYEFADDMAISPIDMSEFLRTYRVAAGEDLDNDLKRILKTDAEIVDTSQKFIIEYLDQLKKARTKISDKNIETILKASDSALKRTTIINKVIEDKKSGVKSAPIEIQLKL